MPCEGSEIVVDFHCKEHYDIQDLIAVMALLRAPGGCPWDREQTHQSIRRNMLEEAYEAVEAIDQDDPEHLKEELGDVLLQVVFHAQMAQEAGRFTFADVVDGVTQKMVFRHPHVFGSVQAENTDQALDTWDAQKREEKDQRTAGDTLDAVARSLPALIRAEKIQNKAAKAGFDWPEAGPALEKVAEEARELQRAAQGDGDKGGEAHGRRHGSDGVAHQRAQAKHTAQNGSGHGAQQNGAQDHGDMGGGGLDDRQLDHAQGRVGQQHQNGRHQGDTHKPAGVSLTVFHIQFPPAAAPRLGGCSAMFKGSSLTAPL